MANVYLVVGKDRHCDDEHTVHLSFASACVFADEFMQAYPSYDWTKIEIPGWLYYHNTELDGDGPSVHIEELHLEGSV